MVYQEIHRLKNMGFSNSKIAKKLGFGVSPPPRDEVIEEAQLAIEKASLSPPEQQRLEELNTQIEAITDRISDLAAKESATSDAIYDATLVSVSVPHCFKVLK